MNLIYKYWICINIKIRNKSDNIKLNSKKGNKVSNKK